MSGFPRNVLLKSVDLSNHLWHVIGICSASFSRPIPLDFPIATQAR